MFFFKKLAGLAYFLVMLAAGASFFCTALDLVPSSFYSEMVDAARSGLNTRIASGIVGLIIMATGFSVLMMTRKNKGRNRLITFHNPDGEVTVSISAIENYVQRVSRDIPGINDVRAAAKVGKKGISITSFVSVAAGTNIPEATESIQMAVKSKVQEMLGVEERITVTMHITKILKDSLSAEAEDGEVEKKASPPFREID